MHQPIVVLIVLSLVIVAVSVLAARVKTPPAILLVLAGIVLALIPGLPSVRLAPDFMLLIVLPPIIYSSAVAMSWREFRFNLRPISLLATGCVAFTAAATAGAAHALLGFSWAEGFVLGAIVSPPDAVAPLAIARRLRLPRRILVILEGEGIANDATALVLYRFAVAAVAAGSFSPRGAIQAFAAITAGEIAWGLAVGWAMLRIRRWVRDPRIEILLSVLTPFAAYWPPEYLGGSGVLATVVAGLYISWNGLTLISAATRLQGIFFWDFLIYVIEGMLFLVTGLQVRAIIHGIVGYSLAQLGYSALMLCVVVIAARFLWMYPAIYLPRWLSSNLARRDPIPPWQWTFALGFTGIRGIVSLTAALALPLSLEDGQSFPHRDLILFLTFAVIFVTLVGQGLSFAPVIRALGLADAGRQELINERKDELAARRSAIKAALARLEALVQSRPLPADISAPLREAQQYRLQYLEHDMQESAQHRDWVAAHDAVENDLLGVERHAVNQRYKAGALKDEPRRRIERELDLREAKLANRSALD